jgi:hypothetical protein
MGGGLMDGRMAARPHGPMADGPMADGPMA